MFDTQITEAPATVADAPPSAVVTDEIDTGDVVESQEEPTLTATPDEALNTPEPDTESTETDTDDAGEEPVKTETTLTAEEAAAELERVAADPMTPKFARDKITEAMNWAKQEKQRATQAETLANELKQQYDGKSVIDPADLERQQKIEDDYLKITSFAATPVEILNSLNEVIPSQKLGEVQSHLAWSYLEQPDGTPNFDNLQVVLDRFLGVKDAGDRVSAQDVIQAAKALQNGTIEPYQLHTFETDEEAQAHQRSVQLQREAESYREQQKQNAQFQESQTREAVLQNVYQTMQQRVDPQINGLLSKLHLDVKANEPEALASLKGEIRTRVGQMLNEFAGKNKSLSEVAKALEILKQPDGSMPDDVRKQIEGYTNSKAFQTQLSRGLSEAMTEITKFANKQAYIYKMAAQGYELESQKGQRAREVVGKSGQTKPTKSLTESELKNMSAEDYLDYSLKSSSAKLRSASA